MTDLHKHTRVGFLLFAFAFAGLALLFNYGQDSSKTGFAISGSYQSKLLDREVSPAALSAVTQSDEFVNVVGGRVEVVDVPESPFHIKVTTILPEEAGLELAHKRGIHLLSTELREEALSEVNSSLRYLEEVKEKTLELKKSRPKAGSTQPKLPEKRLSKEDSQRVVLLRKEIGQLEEFVNGGSLPKALRVKLDRESLTDAEGRARAQEAELTRLSRLFHPSSKAVQAQRVSAEKAWEDLLALERHLAEAYLSALRLELDTLEDKTVSLIEENTARAELGQLEDDESLAEGSAWLAERAAELESRAEVITEAAALKLDGKLTVTERTSASYPLAVSSWVAALFFFLLAVYNPVPRALERPSEGGAPGEFSGPPPAGRSSMLKLQFNETFAGHRPEAGMDRFEVFFAEICRELERTLQRAPRRILVLGDTSEETRLAFSIRLANSLGRKAKRVRLIDFDFQSKGLSERLGRESLPGVGELLLYGGPVEEFFSSIAGTRIQFAPAGNTGVLSVDIQAGRMEPILGRHEGEVTVIDATSASPLHMIVHAVDAVLYTTQHPDGVTRSTREQDVLVAFRDAGLPIWGISVDKTHFFPLL